MRGIQWRSSACAGHAAKRRCNALGACVRLPLRGQHRLARLRCRQAPCFPFNCARRSSAREHQNACECRGRCRQRQGKTDHRGAAAGRRDRTRRPAARGRGGRHGRFARAGRCAIVCAAFGARVRIARMQLNGKQERSFAWPVLSPQRYAARAPRLLRARPGRPRCHCPSGREGCGPASGQPGYRPTQGASALLAERPVREGRTGAPSARAHALRPIRPCLACLPAPVPLAVSSPLPCRGARRGAPDEPRVARRRGPR